MFTLPTFVFIFCSITLASTGTPFKDCGSKSGVIQGFQVTDCTALPCKFTKGHTYAMNLTFRANDASKTASVAIHGIIAGVPVPFPLPDPDACKMNVKCPINQNDEDTATMSLPVLTSYPSISLYVKIELKNDDQNNDYGCLEFPATITSGNTHRRKYVGWKKGKLFEMLS